MKFRFQKINGKAEINWKLINIYLSRWKDDTWFDGEIIRHQHKKSDPMRKYYFSTVMSTIADFSGYEKDEKEDLHKQMKVRYFNIKPDKLGIYRNVPSVFGNKSNLPVSDKKAFVDWVIRKAAQAGCYIEDPRI